MPRPILIPGVMTLGYRFAHSQITYRATFWMVAISASFLCFLQ